jgi:two-component system, OmpR family, sensor kinase
MRYVVMTREVRNGRVRFDAASLADVDSAVRRLTLIAVFGGLSALLAASLLSALIIGKTLRPVDRMVSTSETIAAGDMTARVPTQNPKTELGRLGGSLNTMLNTIEAAIGDRDEKERELRRFIADASHELRTPITVVQGYTDLYNSGALADPPKLERAMNRIENQTVRMARLVQDLLLLANLEQTDFITRTNVDLSALARDCAAEFSITSTTHPVSVVAPQVVTANVDPDRIGQVLDNLLQNVRQHTPSGTSTRVTVSATTTAAIISVADTGPGIPDLQRAQVFERFWRADPTSGRASGSSGLGLSIASSILAAHDGTIHVDSQHDRGTTFTIHIPATPVAT